MPTLNINFDAAVLAHLISANNADTINISITLGDAGVTSAPVQKGPSGPLSDLMKAGLLKAGDKLAFYQRRANRTGRATVTTDGQLVVEGHPHPFSSPSKAAEAVTGNVINGWTLWHTGNGSGPTLDELRQGLK